MSVYIVPANAERIVAYMKETGVTNVRRQDLMSDLGLCRDHTSQALRYAVRQGWLTITGHTRGAVYALQRKVS